MRHFKYAREFYYQMGKQWSCCKAKPRESLLIWSPAECHLHQNASKRSFSIDTIVNQQRLCSHSIKNKATFLFDLKDKLLFPTPQVE